LNNAVFHQTREPKRSAIDRSISQTLFALIAILVGIVTGIGAIIFRSLVGLIHNIFFLGHWSAAYDANLYTPASPWGLAIILVPLIGGMVVIFIVSTFAPEARGHGVPEVMDAIFYRDGKIRPVVAIAKSLASAFSIGTGAAVGREGPIIQIGASLGSTIGQIIRMEPWQRITLVAAGAGAGIAATFNTPIGGVMFAIELMLPEVSVRTFLPVALATGTATFIAQFVLGLRPAFAVPTRYILTNHPAPLYALFLYAGLGAVMGVAATLFIRGLHYSEGVFERVRNPYARHAIGMLCMGFIMYAFLRFSGHYHVEGVGYSTVQDVLAGGIVTAPFLALLFFGKLGGTLLSLGSGSSGGIFSPSLFMGATLGAGVGVIVHMLISTTDMPIAAFAMIGMAAMIGGATGAAMTAVTMIFEMTRDYNIVMPMIVAVAVSIGVRRVLSSENIYTIKLVSRRHFIPKSMHANMFLVRPAGDVMERDVMVLPGSMRFDEFLKIPAEHGKLRHVVVTEGSLIVGVFRVNTLLRQGVEGAYTGLSLSEVAGRDFTIAHEDDIMFTVIGRLWRRGASTIIVVKSGHIPRRSDVLGVITKDHLADSVLDSVRPYFGAEAAS